MKIFGKKIRRKRKNNSKTPPAASYQYPDPPDGPGGIDYSLVVAIIEEYEPLEIITEKAHRELIERIWNTFSLNTFSEEDFKSFDIYLKHYQLLEKDSFYSLVFSSIK